MSVVARQREFLMAYRKAGSVPAALKATDTAEGLHLIWMRDANYAAAFRAITDELRKPSGSPGEPPPKKKMGRPRIHPLPPPDAPKRPPGRPKKNLPPVAADRGAVSQDPPATPSNEAEKREGPPPAPPAGTVAHTIETDGGYTRIFVAEGEALPAPAPELPADPRPPKPAEPPPPALDVSLKSDAEQRALIDEYGELDRRMQLRATEEARYEVLKRAIKSWFLNVPADADGTVEGDVYLLHLSARERERRIEDARQVLELIGLEKFLAIATVPITALENILGKSHVAALVIETRTGSRRIKAIPKGPAQLNGGSHV